MIEEKKTCRSWDSSSWKPPLQAVLILTRSPSPLRARINTWLLSSAPSCWIWSWPWRDWRRSETFTLESWETSSSSARKARARTQWSAESLRSCMPQRWGTVTHEQRWHFHRLEGEWHSTLSFTFIDSREAFITFIWTSCLQILPSTLPSRAYELYLSSGSQSWCGGLAPLPARSWCLLHSKHVLISIAPDPMEISVCIVFLWYALSSETKDRLAEDFRTFSRHMHSITCPTMLWNMRHGNLPWTLHILVVQTVDHIFVNTWVI